MDHLISVRRPNLVTVNNNNNNNNETVQSAEAVEYVDCISVDE